MKRAVCSLGLARGSSPLGKLGIFALRGEEEQDSWAGAQWKRKGRAAARRGYGGLSQACSAWDLAGAEDARHAGNQAGRHRIWPGGCSDGGPLSRGCCSGEVDFPAA